MMDKPRVLESVSALVAEGNLSRAELLTACRRGDFVEIVERHTRYSNLLYFIGGGIVLMGVVGLIFQNWNDLGSAMRVVVSLGSGIVAFSAGVLLSRQERLGAAGPAFFLIAALALPFGLAVTLDEAGFQADQLLSQSLISGLLMGVFAAAYLLFRSNSLLVYAIVLATWAFFALTGWFAGPFPSLNHLEFFEYRAIAVGLSYLFLAFAFADTPRKPLSGFLYGAGTVALLGAVFALAGGFGSRGNVIWGLVSLGLVLAVLGASVYLRSKAMLTFGSIFLVIYLINFTNRFFKKSPDWPLALLFFGLMLMGVGFLILQLKRRYLNE